MSRMETILFTQSPITVSSICPRTHPLPMNVACGFFPDMMAMYTLAGTVVSTLHIVSRKSVVFCMSFTATNLMVLLRLDSKIYQSRRQAARALARQEQRSHLGEGAVDVSPKDDVVFGLPLVMLLLIATEHTPSGTGLYVCVCVCVDGEGGVCVCVCVPREPAS